MYTLCGVYRSYNHVVQHEHDERAAVYQATMAQPRERTKKLFFHSVFVRYNQTDVYSSRGTLVGKRDKSIN